jgi:hypothetical protein
VTAVVDNDFDLIFSPLNLKIVQLEEVFPERFRDGVLSSEEIKERLLENEPRHGFEAIIKERDTANRDYKRLTFLRREIESFHDVATILRDNFDNQDQLHVILLRAVKGIHNGMRDLKEILEGKAQSTLALLSDDASADERKAANARAQELDRAVDLISGFNVGRGLG